MRCELTDHEWVVIKPLPNKPRGVPRVSDRRVLNGIFCVLRSGAPWRDLPTAKPRRSPCAPAKVAAPFRVTPSEHLTRSVLALS
jgi:transposase